MRYKREETFRYEFKKPIECAFNIFKANGTKMYMNPGKARIYDISHGGLKISTGLNLRSNENKIEVEISFSLISSHKVAGEIVWQNSDKDGEYFYGIDLDLKTVNSLELIEELKHYSQKERNINK